MPDLAFKLFISFFFVLLIFPQRAFSTGCKNSLPSSLPPQVVFRENATWAAGAKKDGCFCRLPIQLQIGKMSQLENRIGHFKIQQGTGNKFQIVTNGLVTISNSPQCPVEFQNGLCSFSVPPAVSVKICLH